MESSLNTHVTWHDRSVSQEEQEHLNSHRGCVIWFTGLSGAGKSTIANLVNRELYKANIRSFVLDGDNVRHGLNASPAMLLDHYGESFAKRFGLTFSHEDREENIRRIGAVAELFASAGIIVLSAFISPYRRDRLSARKLVETNGKHDDFIEVFVHAPLEVCEKRDPKGIYKKARAGKISHFTGIDDPYEIPEKPEIVLDSTIYSAEILAEQVLSYLRQDNKIPNQ